jgi:antitoxin component of RelBE/YafQ-DinJ toxin-antitoxin module
MIYDVCIAICAAMRYNVSIMSSTATALTIRTDSKTKKMIADFAASLGLSTSAFITAVTLQAVREQRVVLSPTVSILEPTPYLEKIMREAEADYAEGRNISSFTSTEDVLAHLRSL